MLDDTHADPPPAMSPDGAPNLAPGDRAAPAATNDAAPDETELAAALAAVLSRKPRRPQPEARNRSRPPDDAESGGDSETAIVHTADRRVFASALRNQASSVKDPMDLPEHRVDDSDDAATAPSRSASWLAAARHRSLRRTLNAAGAWIATVAIGTAVVVIAAIMLFEGPRDLEAWLDFAYRTL